MIDDDDDDDDDDDISHCIAFIELIVGVDALWPTFQNFVVPNCPF